MSCAGATEKAFIESVSSTWKQLKTMAFQPHGKGNSWWEAGRTDTFPCIWSNLIIPWQVTKHALTIHLLHKQCPFSVRCPDQKENNSLPQEFYNLNLKWWNSEFKRAKTSEMLIFFSSEQLSFDCMPARKSEVSSDPTLIGGLGKVRQLTQLWNRTARTDPSQPCT